MDAASVTRTLTAVPGICASGRSEVIACTRRVAQPDCRPTVQKSAARCLCATLHTRFSVPEDHPRSVGWRTDCGTYPGHIPQPVRAIGPFRAFDLDAPERRIRGNLQRSA